MEVIGHIYDMYRNIPKLATKHEFNAVDPIMSGNVVQCLKVEESMKPRMMVVLRE